jgi:hypothetical protein
MCTESSLDLALRIAALNAVANQLIAESVCLREQAANLRFECTRVRRNARDQGATPLEVPGQKKAQPEGWAEALTMSPRQGPREEEPRIGATAK